MKKRHFLLYFVNFSLVLLLIGLLFTPLYFAKNFAKVSGIKTESKFLLVSQVEKFPGMTFSQNQDKFTISFTKLGPSQAYLGVLILNNPTDRPYNYQIIQASEKAIVFFGEDLTNPLTKITLPSQVSILISFLSEEVTSEAQTVEFKIEAK